MGNRIRIDTRALSEQIRSTVERRIRRNAPAVAEAARRQTLARFANQGDERFPWPDLWANDDKAVSDAIGKNLNKRQGENQKKVLERRRKSAERATARVREQIRSGKIPPSKAVGRLRTAKNRERIAKVKSYSGNPSFRRGGKALEDTGELLASIRVDTIDTERGVRIVITSNRPDAQYHQTGFKTKGPNFIPLTTKAKRKPAGADPADHGLIPGVDYLVAWRGVTVPRRVLAHFGPGTRDELKRIAFRRS